MKNYSLLRNQTYKKYKTIKSVHCPYLKTKVTFNSNGFRHFIYKAGGKKRDEESQVLRFQLLGQAVKILKVTTTLQEYQSDSKERLVEEHNQQVSKIVTIIYFGFIAILDGWKFKVIVKKIGNGHPFFWSVIPNWRTRAKEKLFHKGNMEED
ncbi:MAG: hypothetical protein A2782_02150 [Candidatus Blackburnbacteria bacterium RIFCSPHIGHO2_01_FULL_43_15b]|uniref:Uncharacterized protein n=1 Tax=Candidatus Blackburnbacteria bacterium RIFCSPHIGHO2_01_FULL_43_15b TaxID=1797513 RepID=A0A1G1V0F6_9BACT|nr:MAG: hypothetical protein A2782_02150 [Candidatus Blackburnbacteria bacterium RIFCSPHIGHO2_01_FULL_43_15b]